jgi:hypothetical protein
MLGPTGYGALKLGQNVKKAVETGLIGKKKSGDFGKCSGYDLKKFPTGKGDANVYISPKRGVVAIFVDKGVKTPEGIGIGSTLKQVKEAYPRLKGRFHGLYTAPVPGDKKAHYYINFNEKKGTVNGLGLVLNKQDCGLDF